MSRSRASSPAHARRPGPAGQDGSWPGGIRQTAVDADFVELAPDGRPGGRRLRRSGAGRRPAILPMVLLLVGLLPVLTMPRPIGDDAAPVAPLSAAASSGPAVLVKDVSARLADANGLRVLIVYGRLVNGGRTPAALPSLAIDLEGRPLTRALQGAAWLSPGEERPFALKFAHAGGTMPRLRVSVAAGREAVAALRP